MYESLEEVVKEATKGTTSFTAAKPPVPPKPSLPPKPTNLRHSQTKSGSDPESSDPPPPLPPPPLSASATNDERPVSPGSPKPHPELPRPPPDESQSDNYIYEIPGEDTVRKKTPPPVAPKPLLPPPKSPVHSVAPPTGTVATRPRPSPSKPLLQETPLPVKQEVVYDLPPDGKKPHPPDKPSVPEKPPVPAKPHLPDKPRPLSTIDEVVYDFPPDSIKNVSDKPRPLSVAEEVLYDLPPPLNIPTSPEPATSDAFSNLDSSFEESGAYQNETLSSPPWKTPSPDSSSDAFYGNVVTEGADPRLGGDVPSAPLPSIKYRAKYSFSATCEEEVSFTNGDIVTGCSDQCAAQDGWIRVRHDDKEGWAPLDYLQPIDTIPVSLPPATPPPNIGESNVHVQLMFVCMIHVQYL